MSGGHFDYKDSSLKAEIFGWADKPTNQFEDLEISHLVWDVLDLIHEYDWYTCGDTGKEDWLKAKAEFKKKWFETDRSKRIKEVIDKVIEDARNELYQTFDIEKNHLS